MSNDAFYKFNPDEHRVYGAQQVPTIVSQQMFDCSKDLAWIGKKCFELGTGNRYVPKTVTFKLRLVGNLLKVIGIILIQVIKSIK